MSCATKTLRQSTLGNYFKLPSSTPIATSLKQKKTKKGLLAKMPKRSYERHGFTLNLKDTYEHGLQIDGSNAEYESKARRIVKWSESRPKFNISAVCGILQDADFKKQFTSSQRDAIDNIYYNCDVWTDY